ncbi:hypothetical protein BT96DRAFT_1063145 [Gymnopus androsaceus JB14]|uniref:Uncharacterized protein n=1 Tax=Gymnopus androsaceus JB14 TaxID=1447944 RepID=A0A6A4GZD2_9AGAR|nr:hypothetical protein BT96DRAFT_1063145 [Gymnopus androsaceus JB14]
MSNSHIIVLKDNQREDLFGNWLIQRRAKLRRKEVLGFIEKWTKESAGLDVHLIGKEKEPEPTSGRNGKVWKAWRTKRDLAVSIIVESLDADQYMHIKGIDNDPLAMVEKLRNYHIVKGLGSLTSIYRKVMHTQKKDDVTILGPKENFFTHEKPDIKNGEFQFFHNFYSKIEGADEEYKLFDVKILQSSKDIHCSLGKGHGQAITFRGPELRHIKTIHQHGDLLESLGELISTALVIACILSSLPPLYKPIITWLDEDPQSGDITYVTACLQNFVAANSGSDDEDALNSAAALATRIAIIPIARLPILHASNMENAVTTSPPALRIKFSLVLL